MKLTTSPTTPPLDFFKHTLFSIVEGALHEPYEEALFKFGEALSIKEEKKISHLQFVSQSIAKHPQYLMPNSLKDDVLKKVKHVRVLQQCIEDVCGFHALNNAILLSQSILSSSRSDALQKIALMQSRREFWRFHKNTVKYLEKKWSHKIQTGDLRSLLKLGPIERYVMNILTTHHRRVEALEQKAHKLGWNFQVIKLDFAYDRFQFGTNYVSQIDQQCNKFLLSKSGVILIAFLGCTNHWVSLVASKTRRAHKPEIFLMDSRNAPILANDTHQELDAMYEARLQENMKFGKKYPQPWMRGVWLQSFKDTRGVTKNLTNALRGDVMLPSIYLTQQIQNFLSHFRTHFQFLNLPTPSQIMEMYGEKKRTAKMQDQLKDYIQEALKWVKGNFPPYILWKDVYKPLDDFDNYLPDPQVSYQLILFFSMVETLVKQKSSWVPPGLKDTAKDLVYIGGKFKERL